MYFIYILECNDKSLYTGITTDVARRFDEHKNGKGGHYTHSRGAKEIVYTEKCKDRSAAQVREAEIKKFTRAEKMHLIQS
ncbi:MAG: GIY-YIG nuclease family protein [Candidatus Pacebacteria bacterium]|nr:GIY-YIG nuclease family protein [Candidatus Paceibacterota bacterium]